MNTKLIAIQLVKTRREEAPRGMDPKNVFVTAIALGVGAVATVGSAYMASKSASAANKTQQDANSANNAWQQFQYFDTRGGNGTSLLPEYAMDKNGNKIEPQIFQQTYQAYKDVGMPDQAAYQAAIDHYNSAQQGADNTVNGIFNGQLTNQELLNQQGVSDARNQGVQARKEGSLEALQMELNAQKAKSATKGYTGDSLGDRLLSFGARRATNTQTATDQANADLANATDVRGVKNAGIDRQLSNINLPYSMARQSIDRLNLAGDATLDRQARRLQLLSTFKLPGTGNYSYQPLPTVQPVANAGQIIGQGVSSLATGLGQMYQQNQNQTALQNQIGNLQASNAAQQVANNPGQYLTPINYDNINSPYMA